MEGKTSAGRRETETEPVLRNMLQVYPWPNAILHLDGDAFFCSVYQAVHPELKGRPVVTGSERGLATAVSYEAKKMGVRRGMLTWQIRKILPSCVIVNSDYELYGLFSSKMLKILRSFTPLVEQYSIDECFADIKGLRRPLHMNYREIGGAIKKKIETSLGITVSVGISLTKSLAKLASSSRKPSGLTAIEGRDIEQLLGRTKIGDVWGIGPNTSAYLQKFHIRTALDFVKKSEDFVTSRLSKPFYEIWRELRGEKVYELDMGEKQTYKSIMRSNTFSPSTNDKDLLWAKLLVHIEDAFSQARRFHYLVGKITPFLKTQAFEYHSQELRIPQKTNYPYIIRDQLKKVFERIHRRGVPYRATGCHLHDLSEDSASQMTLFGQGKIPEEKIKRIYPLYEAKKIDFGSMLFDKQHSIEQKRKRGPNTSLINDIRIL